MLIRSTNFTRENLSNEVCTIHGTFLTKQFNQLESANRIEAARIFKRTENEKCLLAAIELFITVIHVNTKKAKSTWTPATYFISIHLDTSARIISLKPMMTTTTSRENGWMGKFVLGSLNFSYLRNSIRWCFLMIFFFSFSALRKHTETVGRGTRVSGTIEPRKCLRKQENFLGKFLYSANNNDIPKREISEAKFMNVSRKSSLLNSHPRSSIRQNQAWKERRRASSFNKQNSCVRCCCVFVGFCINCSLSCYEPMHMTTLKNKSFCRLFCWWFR